MFNMTIINVVMFKLYAQYPNNGYAVSINTYESLPDVYLHILQPHSDYYTSGLKSLD